MWCKVAFQLPAAMFEGDKSTVESVADEISEAYLVQVKQQIDKKQEMLDRAMNQSMMTSASAAAQMEQKVQRIKNEISDLQYKQRNFRSVSDIEESDLLPLKQKLMYRAQDIELRLKVLCSVEFAGRTLEVYTESIDGAGDRQGANKWPISKATEVDIRVPIFTEMWREGRNEVEGILRYEVAVKLPPSNMDQGALLVDLFELYIHDAKEDITGLLAIYEADAYNVYFRNVD